MMFYVLFFYIQYFFIYISCFFVSGIFIWLVGLCPCLIWLSMFDLFYSLYIAYCFGCTCYNLAWCRHFVLDLLLLLSIDFLCGGCKISFCLVSHTRLGMVWFPCVLLLCGHPRLVGFREVCYNSGLGIWEIRRLIYSWLFLLVTLVISRVICYSFWVGISDCWVVSEVIL